MYHKKLTGYIKIKSHKHTHTHTLILKQKHLKTVETGSRNVGDRKIQNKRYGKIKTSKNMKL